MTRCYKFGADTINMTFLKYTDLRFGCANSLIVAAGEEPNL